MQKEFFRAKRVSSATFVRGYYVLSADRTHSIVNDDGCFWVIHDTLGQFTGLFDANDMKIFEGDIVEPVLTEGIHNGFSWGRHVVVFDQGAFCLKDRRGNVTPMCNYSVSVKFKVLGNIHDDPELMEVSE